MSSLHFKIFNVYGIRTIGEVAPPKSVARLAMPSSSVARSPNRFERVRLVGAGGHGGRGWASG